MFDLAGAIRALLAITLFVVCGVNSALAQKRFALIIANSDYQFLGKLKNPRNDARLLNSTFEKLNFQVDLALDVSKQQMTQALTNFAAKVRREGKDSIAVVFYAGHGMQLDPVRATDLPKNYLVPIDANLKSQTDLPLNAVQLSEVLETVQSAAPIVMVFMDACRDNPLPLSTSRDIKRGLAAEVPRPNLLLGFSTEPGKVALDGDGEFSPYAAAMSRELLEPNIDIEAALKRVRISVLEATGQRQFPWEIGRLSRDLYLSGGAIGPRPIPTPNVNNVPNSNTPASETGDMEFNEAVQIDRVEKYNEWLRKYPNHQKRAYVQALVQRKIEEELWNKAEAAPSTDAKRASLELLLTAYPEGIYSERAKRKIEELNRLAVAVARPPDPQPNTYVPPVVVSPRPTVQRYTNQDIFGGDLNPSDPYIYGVYDEDECERKCTQNSRCVAYTYNFRRSACILKSSIPSLRSSREGHSGVVQGRQASAAPQPTYAEPAFRRFSNRDIAGNDLNPSNPYIRGVRSIESCEQMCSRNSGCAAYTYNYHRDVCILKRSAGNMQYSDEGHSGVLARR